MKTLATPQNPQKNRKEKKGMKITELFLEPADGNPMIATQFIVGEEVGNYGRVKNIEFRNTNHGTTGHTGMPCYVITFESGIRKGVPYERMTETTVDTGKRPTDEDVGAAPPLPED